MLVQRFVLGIIWVGLTALGMSGVSGQTTSTGSGQAYPNKSIRMVTGPPGGTGDFAARLIAQEISGIMGQQVIVDNRPAGVVPAEIVAKAPPDGYTLFFFGSQLWVLPLMQTVPYDPVRDFSPITLVGIAPNVLVVHPSLPANSVKELIALAKARPGMLNYASGGVGSSSHLAGELFKAMAGVNIAHIPYKGTGPALIAQLGGEAQISISPAAAVAPYLKSGRLRALAVTSAQPSTQAPGVPTVAASVPGYEFTQSYGMWAPARTPATVVNRLNEEIVRVLGRSDVKEKFLTVGVDTVGSSPKGFAAAIKSDMTLLGKVIKDAGIRAD